MLIKSTELVAAGTAPFLLPSVVAGVISLLPGCLLCFFRVVFSCVDIQTGRLYVLIQDISAGRHSQLVDTIVCLAETLRKVTCDRLLCWCFNSFSVGFSMFSLRLFMVTAAICK